MITGVELLPILVAMVLLLAGGVTVNADRISFCQSDSPGRAGLLPCLAVGLQDFDKTANGVYNMYR